MTEPAQLPAVAVLYEQDSVSPLRLSTAGRDAFRVIWVIDETEDESSRLARFLRRFGGVVNIRGLDVAESAALIAAQGVDGITAFSDRRLRQTAAIAEQLGLPFFSPTTAAQLSIKHRQREGLRAAGLPVPEFRAIPADVEPGELAPLVEGMSFPLVYKPESGGGSRDTYYAKNLAELVDQAQSITDRTGPDGREPMIVEEWLVGRADLIDDDFTADYVSVEHVVSDGVITAAAITGRVKQAPPFRETGLFIPSSVNDEDARAILDTARAAVAALGVTVGCLHTEIKLTPDGPRVIEVNGRIGGGGIPDLLERISGYSLLRMAGQVALGQPAPFTSMPATKGVGYLFAGQPPMHAQRLNRIDGVPELKNLPGVEHVELCRRVGDVIDWTRGSYGYLFTVLGVATDHQSMRDTYATVLQTVETEYS